MRATPESLRVLARQGVRWLTAAQQDREPSVAVLHANYGRAASDHMRQIASDDEIRTATGIDPLALERAATRIQDAAMRALAQRCPAVAPPRVLSATGLGQSPTASPPSRLARVRDFLLHPGVGTVIALGLVYAVAANRAGDRREGPRERTWRDFGINLAGSLAGTYAFLALTQRKD